MSFFFLFSLYSQLQFTKITFLKSKQSVNVNYIFDSMPETRNVRKSVKGACSPIFLPFNYNLFLCLQMKHFLLQLLLLDRLMAFRGNIRFCCLSFQMFLFSFAFYDTRDFPRTLLARICVCIFFFLLLYFHFQLLHGSG